MQISRRRRTAGVALRKWLVVGGLLWLWLMSPAAAWAASPCNGISIPAGSIVVELQTTLGGVCIELLAQDAPETVANFLDYLDRGEIDGTFFHRSIPGFIVQGGGFRVTAGAFEAVPARVDASGIQVVVPNEPCSLDSESGVCLERGNERGTLALAKIGGNPDSGTTDWFVNLIDNRNNLDNANGGFTVFGRVLGSGMDIFDAIAARPRAGEDRVYWADSSLANVFQDLPLVSLPPFDAVGASFGCFRHEDLAVVLDPADPGLVLPDPTTGESVFTVAGACGSPILLPDFVENPSSDPCPDLDRLAVHVIGPSTLVFPTGSPAYFSLTCTQTEEAIAQRTAWRADFRQRLHAELVTVDATVRVPEPGAAALNVAAGLALLVLRLRRTRATAEQGEFPADHFDSR